MHTVPFQAEHFWAIEPQPAQSYLRDRVSPEHVKSLERTQAFTGVVDGRPVWCFGWAELYKTRALMWAYMAKDAGKYFYSIHKHSKRLVDSLPHRRIEIEVDFEFVEGHRWASMLGFSLECPRVRCHRIDGGDSSLYSRVR